VVTVGAQGNFATFQEALDFARRSWTAGAGTPVEEIRLAAGLKLAEPIVIDNSALALSRPMRIVGEGEGLQAPQVNPSGAGPALILRGAEQVQIRNLRFVGAQRPVVAELSGYLVGSSLRQLQFEQVDQIGLHLSGVRGLKGQPVQLANLLLKGTSTCTALVQLASAELHETAEVEILDCRLIGPAQTGVVIAGGAQEVLLRGNVFHELREGCRLSESDAGQAGLRWINNTFHQCDRGIVFLSGLTPRHERLAFLQNLFVGQQGADVFVETGLEQVPRIFQGTSPSRNNWTDRSSSPKAELDIFSSDGRRGISTPEFGSTDPGVVGFLQPLDPVFRSGAINPEEPLNWIGAVAP
jgi:hypothetical protein